jgi:thiol reductant ABC exporter CydD subunit
MDLGPGWLAGRRTGELTVTATRGLDALDPYLSRYLPQLFLAAVVPAAVGARILLADWPSAVIVALTLPLVPLFMVLVGLATQQHMRTRWRALEVLAGHFLDTVAGLSVLKAYGRSRGQADVVRRVSERHRRETLKTLRIAFLSSLVLELLATLSVALVAVAIGLRLVEGQLSLETGLLVLILAPEAYLPLRRVGEQYHAAAEGVAAAEKVLAVLDETPPRAGSVADVPDIRTAPVVLDAVSARYPDREEDAVHALSLELPPGSVTGLVGPSGAGKSTVLALLLGFLRPASGAVRVGGLDLADVDLAAWRRQVAWVPQRPHLVAGTVADNVRLGTPDAPDAAVAAAAAEAASTSGSTTSSASGGSTCPRVSAGASRSPEPCCATPRLCCSTSRRRTWTS